MPNRACPDVTCPEVTCPDVTTFVVGHVSKWLCIELKMACTEVVMSRNIRRPPEPVATRNGYQ